MLRVTTISSCTREIRQISRPFSVGTWCNLHGLEAGTVIYEVFRSEGRMHTLLKDEMAIQQFLLGDSS
jgi:hypothetical protein